MREWSLVYHQEIDNDIWNIASYIAEHHVFAGARFPDAVNYTAHLALWTPLGYPPHPYYKRWFPNLRHKTIKEFRKYSLYYIAEEESCLVRVMAILHGARDPTNVLEGRMQ